ncbi:DUF1446-domain-containing protein [Aspergillus crustosus]
MTVKRPVRVANCSGYHGDPAYEMYRQATLGDVDFMTGDYLAGKHPGYEETAWEGLHQTIEAIAEKKIKVVINGGALDPKALALKVQALVNEKNLNLRIAYLSGDDLYDHVGPGMPTRKAELQHLDADNSSAVPASLTYAFLRGTADGKRIPMISAHAYLGARGIIHGLRSGADIILCGRVADASPDELAGSLIAGHLIECSAYVTGGNFSGFDKYDFDDLVEPGFPIAEINVDGTCVVTKHPGTRGLVTVDTVRCQFLYELQGTVYLNSDVNAYIGGVVVEDVGKDRVRVSGIRSFPPPSTTKLAIFYQGGYEAEILLNATGYATAKKWDLVEKQVRRFLPDTALKELETLDTTYLRIFVASRSPQAVGAVGLALKSISLKHFSDFHSTLDTRTAIPRPFLAYYPSLIPQVDLSEKIHLVNTNYTATSFPTGHPSRYAPLQPRESYDPEISTDSQSTLREPTKRAKLGDIALARSGDKGGNLNWILYPWESNTYTWLRTFLTIEQIQALLGEDWREEYFIERIEFSNIHAVHFVIYGILGRGVSSSARLDGFGKGVADWFRDIEVDVPVALL